jgi:hypothetical protein
MSLAGVQLLFLSKFRHDLAYAVDHGPFFIVGQFPERFFQQLGSFDPGRSRRVRGGLFANCLDDSTAVQTVNLFRGFKQYVS